MIEAKDLRIGDLVRALDEDDNLKPCKVVGTNLEICHNSKKRGFLKGAVKLRPFDQPNDEPSEARWCIDIEPIPITPDIIKQNGWEQAKHIVDEDGFEWYVFSKDAVLPDLYYYPTDGNDFSAFVCGNEVCHGIKYVHQLQHILWALGLDAEMKV